MPTNPESSTKTPETQESAESQETIDLTRAQTDALKEEITALGGTKDEIKDTFSNFFSKLGEAWKTFIKEGNFSKAIAILFGSTKQESQQTDPTTSTESTNNTTATSTESSTTSTTTNTPTKTKEKEPKDGKVSIEKYIPGIKYDLKYATTDNSFGGKIMYKKTASEYLRMTENAVKKLSKAQEILKKDGLELKIWDAYRPKDAQQKLWDNYKGPSKTKKSNVAVPGTSHHGSGNAIDLTLVDSSTGKELPMPTKFDDFSGKARWDSFSKKNDEKTKNAIKLRRAMEQAGFYTITSEWWHYQTDKGKSTLEHLK